MSAAFAAAASISPQAGFRRVSRWTLPDLVSGFVLALIWLAVSLPRLHGPIDLRWDASTYYILGTALAEGKGYRLLNEPGQIEAVQYPPLLPLLVAAHQAILGTSDYLKVGTALRWTYLALSGFYLAAIYLLARHFLRPLFAFLVAAVSALSFNSFFYPSETLYADLPFAFVAVLFLLCQLRSERSTYANGAGILACAAYFLRTAGIALLVAWVGESLWNRRWKQAAIRAAVAALPILLWQAYLWRVTHSASYQRPLYSYQRASYNYPNVAYSENSRLLDPFRPELGRAHFGEILSRMARNSLTIPMGLGESSTLGRSLLQYPLNKLSKHLPGNISGEFVRAISTGAKIALSALGLLALAGAFLLFRGKAWFLPFYFVLTLGLVVLTPWPSQFWRYLAPLAPLTLIFAISALVQSADWMRARTAMPRQAADLIVGVPLVTLIVAQVWVATLFLLHLQPVSYFTLDGGERRLSLLTYEPHWHALDYAFEWLRRNAGNNAVIVTSVPQLGYLRTGHLTVLPPFEKDKEKAARLLNQVPASFLVVDDLGKPPISNRYIAPLVAQEPSAWRLVFTAPGGETKVYERNR